MSDHDRDHETDIAEMLRRRAADVSPSPDAWESIAARIEGTAVSAGDSGRRVRPLLLAAAITAVVGLVVAGLVIQSDDDGRRVRTAGDPETTTTTPAPALAGEARAVWPATTQAELERINRDAQMGGREDLLDPRSAAAAYLGDRLGNPPGGFATMEFEPVNSESGEVRFIIPENARTEISGVVQVRRLSGAGTIWYVVGATSLRLDAHGFEYDGSRVRGEIRTGRSGQLRVTISSVDGTDPVSEEEIDVDSERAIPFERVFAEKPGVVVVFVLRLANGSVHGLAEVRVDAPPPIPPAARGGPPRPRCSASAVAGQGYHPEGPPAVASMRQRILAAAERCDYDELERLATSGDDPEQGFTFTFGESGTGPADYWREREAEGTGILRLLVLTLRSPHGIETMEPPDRPDRTYYVWPAAAAKERPTDRDWEDLRGLYTDEEIDGWKDAGAFFGYRIGITEQGDWVYFVAGD